MALARTNVGEFISAASHGTGSFVTSSFTPANNSLLVICLLVENTVNASTNANITVSGGGWTYTKRVNANSTSDGDDGAYIFTAPVGTGASMTLTFDCGADNIFQYCAHVYTYTGYDTGTPVGGTGSQAALGGSAPLNFTLSATPATTSEVVATAINDAPTQTTTVGTGWTGQNSNHTDIFYDTETRTGSTSTTVTWDALSSLHGEATVAAEIKEASAITRPVPPQEWPYAREPYYPFSCYTLVNVPMKQQVLPKPQLMGQMVM